MIHNTSVSFKTILPSKNYVMKHYHATVTISIFIFLFIVNAYCGNEVYIHFGKQNTYEYKVKFISLKEIND